MNSLDVRNSGSSAGDQFGDLSESNIVRFLDVAVKQTLEFPSITVDPRDMPRNKIELPRFPQEVLRLARKLADSVLPLMEMETGVC